MRLHFTLSPNTQTVPFDYQHALTGVFHKWLGKDNPLHDGISLYSLSWLHGGVTMRGGIRLHDVSRTVGESRCSIKQVLQGVITSRWQTLRADVEQRL